MTIPRREITGAAASWNPTGTRASGAPSSGAGPATLPHQGVVMGAAQGAVKPVPCGQVVGGICSTCQPERAEEYRAAWGRPAGERERDRRLSLPVVTERTATNFTVTFSCPPPPESRGFTAYIRDGIVVGPLGEEAR